jgi:1-acyl-sn-glycerol-3-phosphate acyltransferase
VLTLVQQLALELHPHRQPTMSVTLDSALEQELGFDSLGRMELLRRLEHACSVHLSEQAVATAESPRDLLRAVHGARRSPTPSLVVSEALPAMPEAGAATPSAATTLTEVLAWHVQRHPQRPHILLYSEDEQVEEVTYAALYQQARAVAAGLQARGLQPGQTVALMLPTSGEFFDGFYGILLAGGIPVPIYPPARLSQIEEHLRRQVGILTNAQTVMMLTVPEAQPLARLIRAQVETLQHVVTVSELSVALDGDVTLPLQPHDTAFLQYTSGSTGTPKGVVLTHANLLANLRAMGHAVQITSTDVFVSWLPLYHDMGLIGAWLGSLYYAMPLVLLSPLAFLARPARWLWAIHRHRGTLSAGPNFAYELCLRKLTEHDLEGLDLSSWRFAFNGAEPVSPSTVTRFCTRFAAYGFRPEAMKPVYGLAEVALGLTFPPLGSCPHIDRIQREPFMHAGQALPAADDDTTALQFVACGQPLPGYDLRMVDSSGFEVGERQVGRLEFRGPSATSGYFRNTEATRQLFHGEWLDSGDMTYCVGNTVYLTGRAKDLIIRAGRNFYPHELEEALNSVSGLRQGCIAVFGSPDPVSGTERLVVLAETRETEPTVLAHMRSRIDAIATDLLGTPPDDVVLTPPHTIPKTSSGKIRRAASRERYEGGALGKRPRAVWWQMVRLAAASLLPQLRRRRRQATDIAYAGYFWARSGLGLLVAWSLMAVVPRRPWRQGIARAVARGLLCLSGTPLTVQGLEHLPTHGPYVLVANHASYLDGFVLTAVLPGDISFVVKRELEACFFARALLQRLGAVFVERFDAQRGVEDTHRILQTIQQGRAVAFFPEGTFRRPVGLLPFRLGAFIVAAQTGLPIIPLGLSGTRTMLRAEQWFPRRGTVRVTIGAPIVPQGKDWTAALALRDAARTAIAHVCGEPETNGHV